MSKRLQVLFDEREYRALKDAARRAGVPVSTWVRRVVSEGRRREVSARPDTKLAAVRRAVVHRFPTADIDQMLAEIERGYVG
jgi:hypothetical protein